MSSYLGYTDPKIEKMKTFTDSLLRSFIDKQRGFVESDKLLIFHYKNEQYAAQFSYNDKLDEFNFLYLNKLDKLHHDAYSVVINTEEEYKQLLCILKYTNIVLLYKNNTSYCVNKALWYNDVYNGSFYTLCCNKQFLEIIRNEINPKKVYRTNRKSKVCT